MKKLIIGGLTVALLAVVGLILPVAPSAQADPLTYRDQQWINKNGAWVCEQLSNDPTEHGVNSLIGSLVLYYEVPGNAGTYILGSVSQLCPQYASLIPALRSPR